MTSPESEPSDALDVLVVGAGPAGMIAALVAAERGRRVAICEQLPRAGRKLLASGGGRCNLSNTLPSEQLLERYGRAGRFMKPALASLDGAGLRRLLAEMGVETHAPDGFRVFPTTHRATTVLDALLKRLASVGAALRCGCEVTGLWHEENQLRGLETRDGRLPAPAVVLATGGRSYPELGATGGGYALAESAGHRVQPTFPAMVPLLTRERWPSRCIAHTIPAASVWVDLPRRRQQRASGDLIFTRSGLAGPVILDLSREIAPLLVERGSVPLGLDLTGGRGEEAWRDQLGQQRDARPSSSVATALGCALPPPLAQVMCELTGVEPELRLAELSRRATAELAKLLAHTPIEVIGTEGFDRAMVTRGGVHLREVDPTRLESRLLPGLFFCGEILDVDGPCGGYNLQWAFSSGHLAGTSV